MLNLQNETIKQFYKSPFVKTSGDTTSPMLLASCGPPLRPPPRGEVWLCSVCGSRTNLQELLSLGKEIEQVKDKLGLVGLC